MHVNADPQGEEVDKDSQIKLESAPEVVVEVAKHLVTNVTQFTVMERGAKRKKKKK